MKAFPTTRLSTRPGDIFKEAEDRAIMLTRHGREAFVLMPLSLYDYMASKAKEEAAASSSSMDIVVKKAQSAKSED